MMNETDKIINQAFNEFKKEILEKKEHCEFYKKDKRKISYLNGVEDKDDCFNCIHVEKKKHAFESNKTWYSYEEGICKKLNESIMYTCPKNYCNYCQVCQKQIIYGNCCYECTEEYLRSVL